MRSIRQRDAEKASYPILRLCHVLGVSQSGYIAWLALTQAVPGNSLNELYFGNLHLQTAYSFDGMSIAE